MQKVPQDTLHEMPSWQFKFCEGSLSSSAQIQNIAEQCNLFRPPTIVFGYNFCQIKSKTCDFKISYNAKQALKYINYQFRQQNYYKQNEQSKPNGISYLPPKLQIKHAQKWKQITAPKDIEITKVKQSSDSFFVTPFKGKIQGNVKIQKSSQIVIPIQKLGPHNEMRFYKQGSLYQDQLDDNGLIQYEYKFRTMADGNWFMLIRCYVRVDDVAVLILDTRLYWEEGQNKLARQFMVKESKWAELKAKGFQTTGGWTTNQHQSHLVYEYLQEKFVQNQYILFGNI